MAYRTVTTNSNVPSRFTKAGLRFVGKRYVPEDINPAGVTLLFFHCAGSHKEVFEPIIAHLLLLKDRQDGAQLVREVWSFDMQNHGEAGFWNADVLNDVELTVTDWSDGFKAFASSGVLHGHRLIAIGHSLGATTAVLATIPGELAPIKVESLVIIEPAWATREVWNANLEEREAVLKMIARAVMKRRDTWSSRQEAKAFFEERLPWSLWDPRILDLYVLHGLRETPAEQGETAETKVVLACPKVQENIVYTRVQAQWVALDWLRDLDRSVAVHFILGGRPDIIPEYCHESAIGVRSVTSVQKVPNGGHFVVQENPDGVACAIEKIISELASARAKL